MNKLEKIQAQKRASKKYETNTVESIRLRVPKGKRVLIQKCAEKNHESVNGMLNRLIDKEMARVNKQSKAQ